MSEYSPQADELLELWKCLSMNMRSVILRSRYLQQTAERNGTEASLARQIREKSVNEFYQAIGKQMRNVLNTEGIEKSLPEEEPDGFPRRFVDFRISEDAIPQISLRLMELNDEVIKLLITLCAIRL